MWKQKKKTIIMIEYFYLSITSIISTYINDMILINVTFIIFPLYDIQITLNEYSNNVFSLMRCNVIFIDTWISIYIYE